jgi:hypothetical protein
VEKTYWTIPGSGGVLEAEGKGFYVGLDIGQSRDYTAVIVLEKVWYRGRTDAKGRAYFEHHIRDAYRYPLGTPYPDMVRDVKETYLDNPSLCFEETFPGYGLFRARPHLMVDATGVGAAIRDEFEKLGIRRPTLRPVIITGGLDENFEKGSYRVPKSRLLEKMQVDAQFGQLKIAGGLDELETLKRELANVKPKMKLETAYLSYEEIREGEHDDLVLAASLAHWGAHKFDNYPAFMTLPQGWRYGGV